MSPSSPSTWTESTPRTSGAILDADFNIAVRVGLHCAPLVHQYLGTLHRGAVRFSPGIFNTPDDIDQAVKALASLSVCR